MSVAEKSQKKSGGLGETVSVIIQALILALVIRTFLFQPFSIPSGSMRPTLLEGDYLFVTKWAYGYSRYSLPFSPDIFSGRIWGSAPKRGDVVVFKFPPNPSLDYIKRVIGLPGDKLYIANSHVYVDGRALGEPYVRKGAVTLAQPPYGCGFSGTISDPYVVPKGMAFVMGDNRDDSIDSRCFGPIPDSTIVGRAFVKIWPLNRFGGL